MSQPSICSKDVLDEAPVRRSAQSLRVICFLKPGEYANRFERYLARQDVVVLRARHEMHAYWTALTTAPDALITDIPLSSFDRNYLLSRLGRNPKTAQLPILVLGTDTGRIASRNGDLPAAIQVLEVTTPTKMAELALHHVRRLRREQRDQRQRCWRTDEPRVPRAQAGPKRPRRAHPLPHEPATGHTESAKNAVSSGVGMIVPRRRENAPADGRVVPGTTCRVVTPRRVDSADGAHGGAADDAS